MKALREILGAASLPARKAFLGFDGYVDSLYRVIRSRDHSGKTPFQGIADFGQELASRAGLSGGFELDRISVRAGGNAPLMAAALSALEVSTSVAGTMGIPSLHAAFEDLGKRCRLMSVARPADTVALEFADGKIMLGDTQVFEALTWKRLCEALGLEHLRREIQQADLLALVNWANMSHSTDLWRGVLDEGLKGYAGPPKTIFFDLADINRCGEAETRELLPILGRFRLHGRVALGLNENEAWQLAQKLGLKTEADSDLEVLGSDLLGHLDVDSLVIHPRTRAITFEGGEVHSTPGRVVAQPRISTGGGDNFNAGFCWGLLQGLSAHEAAKAAVLVSSLYVEQGRSPSRAELSKVA